MATKKKEAINDRCPLASECERKKCMYYAHELDCIYYETNANGSNVIEDQEEIRNRRYNAAQEELYNQQRRAMEQEVVDRIFVEDLEGQLSKGNELRMIPLGEIVTSDKNIFEVEDDISDLKDDIELNGLLTPLTVCKAENGYRLISGHRRYKALRELYQPHHEVPCLVVEPTSPEAEEYMLLRANLSSRIISFGDLNKARERAEAVLVEMKKQGVEFPGKLRTHVANLLKISEAKLAKIKFVSDNMITELQTVPEDQLPFSARYVVAHWSNELQHDFYNSRVKGKKRPVYDTSWLDSLIKSGRNPFEEERKSKEKAKETSASSSSSSAASAPTAQNKAPMRCRIKAGFCCEKEKFFSELEDPKMEIPGFTYECKKYCCAWCPNRYICKHVCTASKERIQRDYDKMHTDLYYKINWCLVDLCNRKGLTANFLESCAEQEHEDLGVTPNNLFAKDAYDGFDVGDLLWYLKKLEISIQAFFDILPNVKGFPHAEPQ